MGFRRALSPLGSTVGPYKTIYKLFSYVSGEGDGGSDREVRFGQIFTLLQL